MIFRRRAAKRAFSHLCSLDPHASERAELAAAGVGSERIATLYGKPFSALTPGLIEHLAQVSDHQLLQIQPWSDRVTVICKCLPDSLLAERRSLGSRWPTGAKSGHVALDEYLNQRFKPYEKQRDALMVYNSVWQLGDALWHAHWLMGRRAMLPWRARRRTDGLMLKVASVAQLSKKF